MEKSIDLLGNRIEYTLAVSNRARRMRISIFSDGRVVATIPRRISASLIEPFFVEKSEWILKKLDYFKKFPAPVLNKQEEKKNFARYREHALRLAQERIDYFNAYYGFAVNAVYIRNQKTRWGSCSKKGNLNFNYKIVFLPPHMSDYIIVHELCHLQELNHSKDFWNLVARKVPNHREIRKELKISGMRYG